MYIFSIKIKSLSSVYHFLGFTHTGVEPDTRINFNTNENIHVYYINITIAVSFSLCVSSHQRDI